MIPAGHNDVPAETDQIVLFAPARQAQPYASGEPHAMRRAISAVLFDLDGVLVDSHDTTIAYYSDIVRRFGVDPISEPKLMRRATEIPRHDFLAAVASRWALELDSIEALVAETVYPFGRARFPKNCKLLLRGLSGTYKVGVVTSRVRREAEYLLEAGGYPVDELVAFEDSPEAKPSPMPIQLVCNTLQVPTSEAVFVGDAPTDCIAASAAGSAFVWVGEDAPNGAAFSVPSADQLYVELPMMLDQLNRGGPTGATAPKS